jgi:hypothetical protein
MNWLSMIVGVLMVAGVSASPQLVPQNNCVSFSVGPGTGCSWMCNYCADNLGTNNYYFTDGVCTYETGGCSGNPIAGHTYTCCSSAQAYKTC